jgi:hypothetical protein
MSYFCLSQLDEELFYARMHRQTEMFKESGYMCCGESLKTNLWHYTYNKKVRGFLHFVQWPRGSPAGAQQWI